MKALKKIFEFVVMIQIVLTFFFILENINNLSTIEYQFAIGDDTYSFELNMYVAFAVLAVIFLIVLLASLQIFGSGINDEGSKTLSKYIAIVVLFIVLSIGPVYYFASLNSIGIILSLFMIIAYFLQGFNSLLHDNEIEAD